MKKVKENKMFRQEDLKDLLSLTDLSTYIGWHKAKVNTYRRRSEDGLLKKVTFPEPYVYIASKAFWSKVQIDIWAEENKDRLGQDAKFLKK